MNVLVRRRTLWALLFISPWIVGFIAFTLYPIVASFYFSFTNFNAINFNPRWVGLQNYEELFLFDRNFWIALGNTLRYAGLLIVLATAFDLVIAMLLNIKVRGLSIYRTIFYLPVVVPTVAAVLTWIWVLNPQFGLLNGLLKIFGIQGPPWLASPNTALLSIVLVAVWGSGRAILIYLAGLQDIPRHLYEAAEIDGANAFQRMRFVTLPLLTPQIFFNMVILIIFSMQAFAEPLIMTNGGPNKSTLLYSLYLYQRAFEDLSMGYASAMAWILFLVILVFTLLFVRLTSRFVVYDR